MSSERLLLKINCTSGEKFMIISHLSAYFQELISLIEQEFSKHSINKPLRGSVAKLMDENDYLIPNEHYGTIRVGDVFQSGDAIRILMTYGLEEAIPDRIEEESDDFDELFENSDDEKEKDVVITEMKKVLEAEDFEGGYESEVLDDIKEDNSIDIVNLNLHDFDQVMLTFLSRHIVKNSDISIREIQDLLIEKYPFSQIPDLNSLENFLLSYNRFIVSNDTVSISSQIDRKNMEIIYALQSGLSNEEFDSIITVYKGLPKSYLEFISEYYVNFPDFLKSWPSYFIIKEDRVRST